MLINVIEHNPCSRIVDKPLKVLRGLSFLTLIIIYHCKYCSILLIDVFRAIDSWRQSGSGPFIVLYIYCSWGLHGLFDLSFFAQYITAHFFIDTYQKVSVQQVQLIWNLSWKNYLVRVGVDRL